MKPKDLKPPFSWETRRVTLEDRVLCIPERIDFSTCSFPGWKSIFENDHPVAIEFCSGNGDWIIDQALKFPERNWVAVEKRFDRVRKIWSKRENLGAKNVLIVCSMAQTFASQFVPIKSTAQVFVNFPDPWPKDRHAKHRLYQAPFVNMVYSLLKDEGDLIGVTDDKPYMEQILSEVMEHGGFTPQFEAPYTRPQWPCEEDDSYGKTSYFEALWTRLGRSLNFYHFKKRACIGTES
jgi:tRNA (guanine-N7-)-methyltransferase